MDVIFCIVSVTLLHSNLHHSQDSLGIVRATRTLDKMKWYLFVLSGSGFAKFEPFVGKRNFGTPVFNGLHNFHDIWTFRYYGFQITVVADRDCSSSQFHNKPHKRAHKTHEWFDEEKLICFLFKATLTLEQLTWLSMWNVLLGYYTNTNMLHSQINWIMG